MSSHVSLRVHFVWSTCHREPWIDPAWAQRLYAYLGTVLQDRGGVLLAAGGVPDHLHLYASLPPTLAVAKIANAPRSDRELVNGPYSFEPRSCGVRVTPTRG